MSSLYMRLVLGREDGQTMAEYGVVLTTITLALVASFTFLGDAIEGTIDNARDALR